MDNESNTIEDSLLAKFLAGDATPEEAIAVNEWIAASEENELHYLQFEKIWSLNKKVAQATPDRNLLWTELNGQLKPRRKKSPGNQVLRIAASILVVISVGFAFYLSRAPQVAKDIAWITKQTSTEVANLNLPDGSAVTVNRNSLIKWPEKSADSIREVRLQGEAFFDVSHNPQRPFVVSAEDVKIKVLGTVFNVSNSSLGNIETEVIRGKVMMYTAQRQIIIEAGMKGVYDKATKELRLLKLQNENSVAYATHVLTFKSISLKEVCEHLSKTYGVQFIFENKKVEQCTLTSAYSNKSLSFIMDVISESLGVTYQIKGNSVYISGDGCL